VKVTDPDDELDELARKGRAIEPPREREPRAAKRTAAEDHAGMALAAYHWKETGAVKLPLLVVPVIASVALLPLDYLPFTLFPGLGVGFFAMWLVGDRLERWAEDKERAWLVAQPVALDLYGYLAFLGRKYDFSHVVTARVAFEHAPDDAGERARCADATRGAMAGRANPSWDDDLLVIESPLIDTRFTGARGPSYKSNAELHRWVRALIEHALLPIARAHPLARLTIG
jgi:hypothetical protein